nr:zf-HC2 domain-containing protein [candidate division Zixibacteria bacterium]
MNCARFKEILSLKMGELDLSDEERIHLEGCASCRAYYDDLVQMEKSLEGLAIAPLSAVEFAIVQEKLDRKITSYLGRATGLYNFMVRYGSSVAAVFMIVFVSLVSHLGPATVENNVVEVNYTLLNSEDVLAVDQAFDEQYVQAMVGDYAETYGIGASDQLFNDITAEEYEYLVTNMDIGGIL